MAKGNRTAALTVILMLTMALMSVLQQGCYSTKQEGADRGLHIMPTKRLRDPSKGQLVFREFLITGHLKTPKGNYSKNMGLRFHRTLGPVGKDGQGRFRLPAPRPGEELWVIESSRKPRYRRPIRKRGDKPTQGKLMAKLPNSKKQVPLPLRHTEVKARISAFISSVDVSQLYHNPYESKIEAVYIFPLPQNAAVTNFVMTIGQRRIRGLIREKEEAKRIYRQAKRRGYVASLLTQERPNIFTQKVANIEPGKKIKVKISYFSPLPYRDGEYVFAFPMVVGPRFNPPGFKSGIGAVARGKSGISGQKMEVTYLKPGMRSGHDISIDLDLDAGVKLEEIYSSTHTIALKREGANKTRIRLKGGKAIPDRDFILRYRVAGQQLKTALMVNRAKSGNTFALVLHPPKDLRNLPRMPREMVFVLDCSGSMSGRPMAKAKEAMRRSLKKLDPNDTFQIIRFSNRASQLGKEPLPATSENIQRALKYVARLRGSGGTMMIEGIKAALDFAHDERRLRIVSFMTDGYIGNEARILQAIQKKLGAARIFSFGVGSSVNRYLLESMARVGKGAVAFVGLDQESGKEVDRFYDRVSRPALTDLSIDWGNMKISQVYPKVLPDLFVGRPVLITGRFEGKGPATIKIKGRAGQGVKSYPIKVDLDAEAAQHPGIRSIWARWRIRDLSDQESYRPSKEMKDEITKVSLTYSVLSRYTAFLAVDSLKKTAGQHGFTVKVPVPVPYGVRYDTTVKR